VRIRWLASMLVVLCATGLTGAVMPDRAWASTDVESFVGSRGTHLGQSEPRIGYGLTGVTLGVAGPEGAAVRLIVGLSTLDRQRVDVSVHSTFPEGLPCQRSGEQIQCEFNLSSYPAHVTVVYTASAGVAAGPAGYLSVRAEPVADNDPDQSNNNSRVDVDLRTGGQSHFGIKASDATGSLGSTVTVAVTITNGGPDTIRDIVLINPTGGGGKDFAGGDGCSTGSIPQCPVPRIPPGTSKTVNLRFRIRRCFQPVPGDPEYGAPLDGGVPFQAPHLLQTLPSDTVFRITVRGCAQAFTAQSPAHSPGPSPTATPEPSPPSSLVFDTATAAPTEPPSPDLVTTGAKRTTFYTVSAVLLIAALALAGTRLLRRRKNL